MDSDDDFGLMDCSQEDADQLETLLQALTGIEKYFNPLDVYSESGKPRTMNDAIEIHCESKEILRTSFKKPSNQAVMHPNPTHKFPESLYVEIMKNMAVIRETAQLPIVSRNEKNNRVRLNDPRIYYKKPELLMNKSKNFSFDSVSATKPGTKLPNSKTVAKSTYTVPMKLESKVTTDTVLYNVPLKSSAFGNQNNPDNIKTWFREIKQTYSINEKLSDKMLITVFHYLTVHDRKVGRLVCKRWMKILDKPKLANNRKIICSGIYSPAHIFSFLLDSNITQMNLEFHRVEFQDVDLEFWHFRGSKIRELYFIDCELSDKHISEIITKCSNMQHLSISFLELIPDGRKFCNFQILSNLAKNEVVNENLTSLDVNLNDGEWMSNIILQCLFIIFPRISKLKFVCHTLDSIDNLQVAITPEDITLDLSDEEKLTFSCILNNIHLASVNKEEMKVLKIDVHAKMSPLICFAWESIIKYSQFTKLQEILMEVDLKHTNVDQVIDYCTRQKHLKKLNFTVFGYGYLVINSFLRRLLDKCERLTEIDITYDGEVYVSLDLLKKLTLSKLRSISFRKMILLSLQIENMKDEWPVNTTLRSLRMCVNTGETFNDLFMKTFQSLRYLEIYYLTDTLLHSIWRYQTNLVTLKLLELGKCTNLGFVGFRLDGTIYSIQRLQKLEYLVLESTEELKIDIAGLSEFQLPKLRCLSIKVDASPEIKKQLIRRIECFETIEYLSLTLSCISRVTWLMFSTSLKSLRYLKIVDSSSGRFKDKEYEMFFRRHPKLRGLHHQFQGMKTASYYLNILSMKVERKISKTTYRISSEKIGDNHIDWLQF